jgi:hypothetical protein
MDGRTDRECTSFSLVHDPSGTFIVDISIHYDSVSSSNGFAQCLRLNNQGPLESGRLPTSVTFQCSIVIANLNANVGIPNFQVADSDKQPIIGLPKFSPELMQRTRTARTEPTVLFSSGSVRPLDRTVLVLSSGLMAYRRTEFGLVRTEHCEWVECTRIAATKQVVDIIMSVIGSVTCCVKLTTCCGWALNDVHRLSFSTVLLKVRFALLVFFECLIHWGTARFSLNQVVQWSTFGIGQ